MQEVAFDEDFPPEAFEPRAPEGEQFESVAEERSVPLRELQGRVPFTVLVPAHPPVPGPDDPGGAGGAGRDHAGGPSVGDADVRAVLLPIGTGSAPDVAGVGRDHAGPQAPASEA